jgi:uncharacterized protein YecT (DUF1311 family)
MRYLCSFLFFITIQFTFGQTQSEMNQDASNEWKKVNTELNNTYEQILTEYQSDTAFINNLKISQQLWIQFTEAELLTKFPERGLGYYGTAHPACVASYEKQLIIDRIKSLKVWTEGIEEGDMCSGSVKMK